MKKSGSSNQLLSLAEDESERDRDRSAFASGSRNRSGSPVTSRGRAESESPTRTTEKTPKSASSTPLDDHRNFSQQLPEFESSEGVKTLPVKKTRSSRSVSQLSPVVPFDVGVLVSSNDGPASATRRVSEASSVRKKRESRRIQIERAPISLAETLKAAIDDGMPSPKPLSSTVFHSISKEHALQLLVLLLLLSSALLPCDLPIDDCVAMAVIYAITIIFELVLTVKLKLFNFASDHINVASLYRYAENLSPEVCNVHLNKSISTIAVQRNVNGVESWERNMAALVPLHSVVKFHPSEKDNLPVGIAHIDKESKSSRWTYALVSQNLAVDCLKRLLQRQRAPSVDRLTHSIQVVLSRLACLLITVACVVLFAFVRAPVSDLSMAFRSIAVLLMPLLPSMMSLSLSLSVAVINASISSHLNISPSAVAASAQKGRTNYTRLEETTQESSDSAKWNCHSCLSKLASYFRRILNVRALPAVSDDNQHPVELSPVSVVSWLFNSWNRMFHDFNQMYMMSRVTVLCVLDKEGILAQPQPEARYVMYCRALPSDDAEAPVRRTSLSRTASISAADIVDASFVTVPITQNDNGKWEFRFENDPDKAQEKCSLEIFRQIAVCSQMTTDKLDIDEDAPKPANACVKGLMDLCTVINEQYSDKNVPVQDKVPIWKERVDFISQGEPSNTFFTFSQFYFTSRYQMSPLRSFSDAAHGAKSLMSACLGGLSVFCTTRPSATLCSESSTFSSMRCSL